jgi:DNA-binding NarL/FixJ family response regulator
LLAAAGRLEAHVMSGGEPRKTRILIVDDHVMVRDGLAMRIQMQSDLMVCGEAETEEQAFELVKQGEPDLVLVDISLKEGRGLELIKRIKAYDPGIKMLVLSMYDEQLYAERALRAGAMGYLNKQESREKVMEAIRTVLAGDRYLSPSMTQRLVAQAIGRQEGASSSPVESLTDRELEIFRLIGKGLTTRAIANRLHLSPHTIDTHRENIKGKLNAKNAAELSRVAVQWVLENG